MLQFVLSVVLFFMLIMSLFSIGFASRGLPAIVWNFFWFYIITNTATRVFESDATWLGLTLASVYLYKAFTRKQRAQKNFFVFKNFSQNPQDFDFRRGPFQKNAEPRDVTLEDPMIIDVPSKRQ